MLTNKIKSILPTCCDVGFIQLSDCSSKEQGLIKEFLSETKTIIVLFHHVKTSLEWAWYPHESERNNQTCGADLHSKNVIDNMKQYLKEEGYISSVLPYPGTCGIRMKDFADKTGIGQIGDNYLFLHKEWGPWVHLRLLLTNAEFETTPIIKHNICTHCGMCIKVCPANAIKADSFEGLVCSHYQMSQQVGVKDHYNWKCGECAKICPVGIQPIPLRIVRE